MLLLDLPTRWGDGFATVAMADRPPSNRRLAGRDRWGHLKLMHPIVARGLAACDCLRHVEAVDDGDGLVAVADFVASHGIGLRFGCGCRRAAVEAIPPAGMNQGTLSRGSAAQSLAH